MSCLTATGVQNRSPLSGFRSRMHRTGVLTANLPGPSLLPHSRSSPASKSTSSHRGPRVLLRWQPISTSNRIAAACTRLYSAFGAHHIGYYRSASTLNALELRRSAVVVRRAAVTDWTRAVEIEMVEGTDE